MMPTLRVPARSCVRLRHSSAPVSAHCWTRRCLPPNSRDSARRAPHCAAKKCFSLDSAATPSSHRRWETMIKLYYHPSNASMAPHMLLEEITVPFELLLVDRARAAHKSPEYLK